MKNETTLQKISDFVNKSLLIVDDDNPFRERLARAMEKKGFEVIQAEGVQKGIDSVKAQKPGFAVVDLRLGDGNGLEVVKQIQLLTLIIILISTVIAIGSELYQMFKIQTVTLADLLLLFLYLEVLAMVRVFWESQSIQITLPLFIAITALSRFIILQGKSINPEILVYEAGANLLIALAILVLRFRNSPIVGLDKKKKK